VNFLFAGLIHLALPNARIIHIRRDPIDTCFSAFSKLFTTAQPHTFNLTELGRYYRAYETLMAHWRRVLPEGVMLEARYEELVADFEPQARRLIAYCGLEWDERCLAFHQTRRSVRTASAHPGAPAYLRKFGRALACLRAVARAVTGSALLPLIGKTAFRRGPYSNASYSFGSIEDYDFTMT
jgi:hypothetical protein